VRAPPNEKPWPTSHPGPTHAQHRAQLVADDGSSSCKKKRVASLAEKRGAAASAWARSTAHRSVFSGRPGTDASGSEMDLDVARSEQAVRTRPAAYSIGKRPRDAAVGKGGDGHRRGAADEALETPPPFYDVNIDAASTRKRRLCTPTSSE
jgi:hypothetical protein